MMINSAEEFVRLRASTVPADYGRAATESADESVWLDVIDRYPDMSFWVAQNKTVPDHVLEVLAGDQDSKVRWMVARKRKVSREILCLLTHDPDELVRIAVARHRNAPEAAIAILAEDASPTVREIARSRLE
jgi:hypothetical protein